MTKKSEIYQVRKKEIRDSRIKETQNFIRSESFSSTMNNHEWFRVFELIQEHLFEFEIKTLISSEIKRIESILELEKSSILIDNSGEFIEFLELEQITLKNTLKLKSELDKLNVDFYEELDKIRIQGYRK